MEHRDFMLGVVRHFPKGSGDKLKGKKLFLGGSYCDDRTGVG